MRVSELRFTWIFKSGRKDFSGTLHSGHRKRERRQKKTSFTSFPLEETWQQREYAFVLLDCTFFGGGAVGANKMEDNGTVFPFFREK